MVPARDAVFQNAAEASDLWEEAVAAARQMGDDVPARFGLLYLAYLGASRGDFPAGAATWLERPPPDDPGLLVDGYRPVP